MSCRAESRHKPKPHLILYQPISQPISRNLGTEPTGTMSQIKSNVMPSGVEAQAKTSFNPLSTHLPTHLPKPRDRTHRNNVTNKIKCHAERSRGTSQNPIQSSINPSPNPPAQSIRRSYRCR